MSISSDFLFSAGNMCNYVDVCTVLYMLCVVSAKSEAANKKQKVADLLSRNFNAFQKLSIYVEPVLGV